MLILNYILNFFHKEESKEWEIAYVTLHTQDFSSMRKFYHSVLGFTPLRELSDGVLLGLSDGSKPLIQLKKGQVLGQFRRRDNLYYFAIKLPTQDTLGGLMNHLLLQDVTIIASCDDGYSESFYIHDPDGNRIKFYWDKPLASVKEVAITHREASKMMLSIDHFLHLQKHSYRGLPKETRIGQINLSTLHLEESLQFYQKIFHADTTMDYVLNRKNLVLNSDHYSIVLNSWDAITHYRDLPKHELARLTIFAPSISHMEQVVTRLEELQIPYTYTKNHLFFTDKDDNSLELTLKE